MKNQKDTFLLNNGNRIPCVGYGTWLMPEGEEGVEAIISAVKTGYRHIDTAFFYKNEKTVGEAIRRCGLDRGEIFVTTKLWNTEHTYEKAKRAIDESLMNLGLDYLDLYLIHWPIPKDFRDCWQETNAETWRAMEEAVSEGKLKSIGVSNFRPHHLEPLLKSAKICPAVNQVECHIGTYPTETVNYCRQKGILIEAWAPLNRGQALKNEHIVRIGEKYGKTSAQIHLRWCLQNGILPLPKSMTPSRIAENIDIFDFEISQEDMEFLDGMTGLGDADRDPDNLHF